MTNSASRGGTGASQGAATPDSKQQEHAAKLVLTADFRVPDPSAKQSKKAQADEDIAEDVSDNVRQLLSRRQDRVKNRGARVASLESTIAELEAAISQQNGEWEPDGSGFEEDASTESTTPKPAQDWVDSTAEAATPKDAPVEENIDAATVEDVDSASDDESIFAEPPVDEESVIDEETLRNIVGEIVREELKGALGERITRNVRKLVRREINLVLSAQDFK